MTPILDATDVSIIRALIKDGRQPATEIASSLEGVSERVVQYRIEKLIRDEIIRVVAIINLEPLGFSTRADILIDVEPGTISFVSAQLATYEEVSYVASHFGQHDISVTVHARNNRDFFNLLNDSITSIPGIANVQPILLPRLLKYPFLWFGEYTDSSWAQLLETSADLSNSPYLLQPIDREIINLLVENGRLSYSEIARSIEHYSPQYVGTRIEGLILHGVIRISALVSPEKLGYQVRADVFVKSEPGQTIEVAQRLAQLAVTSRVACSMGGDISVQVCGRTNQEIYTFLTETIPQIPGVKRTHTNIIAHLDKEFYSCQLPKYLVQGWAR